MTASLPIRPTLRQPVASRRQPPCRAAGRRPASVLAGLLALAAALAALPAPEASAVGFGRFQKGGRATGQVGARTASVIDPSAVYYNPAAIIYTEGLEMQAGLDFSNSTDNYESSTAGRFEAHHSIQFPPEIYLTWNPDPRGPWAFGIGVDTPWWYRADFDPALFPGRFKSRVLDIALWEVHPVAAYDLGSGWSVGGGLRYVFGDFQQGSNAIVQTAGTGGQLFPGEIFLDADSSVDGYGFDGALDYRTNILGFGVVYRSGVKVTGGGKLRRNVRDAPIDPVAATSLQNLLRADQDAHQGLDLPNELRSGVWFAPYPELRVELDVALTGWSSFEQTFGPRPVGSTTDVQRSGWDDTLSVRLGVEGDLTDNFKLNGGIAMEPSPVPDDRVDPAFFRGDSLVYGLGFSYDFPQLSFDLGYSFHDYDDRTVRGQEPQSPNLAATYASREQVWAASARWRF